MQEFHTTAPITTVLDIPAGHVQFIAADRVDTLVEVSPADPAKGRDIKAAEQTAVTYADDVLRITAPTPSNQLFGPSGSLAITVRMPAGSRIEGKAASVTFRGVGRFGDITFEGAHRRIKIDEAVSIRLTAVEGDVEIGRLGGSAQIRTTRGDIRIAEAARGTLVLRTQSGDISVASGSSATLDARTDHGRVANGLKNDGVTELEVQATTSRGHITARGL
ncbi:DUF4097 family beta strand repeat-containing protein [Streptomyces sp. NPDC006879]|uniref:DUF4097 family beta strand repeat-containing protein n=1 Tax=Streptomyces sp. NPDC006879 TaxID=3364767 RepID=UPI00368EB838